MILRKATASAWTKDLDDKMNQWLSQYINWLENNSLALEEKASTKFVSPQTSALFFFFDHVSYSNHGSYYYNQIGALKILVGDNSGALNVLGEYFNGIYMNQINADGEQPLEAERTRPYHYRAYNLAAMIVSPAPRNFSRLKRLYEFPFSLLDRRTLAYLNMPAWTFTNTPPALVGRSRWPSILR